MVDTEQGNVPTVEWLFTARLVSQQVPSIQGLVGHCWPGTRPKALPTLIFPALEEGILAKAGPYGVLCTHTDSGIPERPRGSP